MGLCCTLQNPLSDSIHILFPTNNKGRLVGTFNTCKIHLYLGFLHNCNLTWFHRYHTIDALLFQTEISKLMDFCYIIINVIILIFKIIVYDIFLLSLQPLRYIQYDHTRNHNPIA